VNILVLKVGQRTKSIKDFGEQLRTPHFDGEVNNVLLEELVGLAEDTLGIQNDDWFEEKTAWILLGRVGEYPNLEILIAHFGDLDELWVVDEVPTG